MVNPATAQTVVDGDTIKLEGVAFRLWGIDAPESHQSCADGWAAGLAVSRAVYAFVEGRAIACEPRGRDRYGWMSVQSIAQTPPTGPAPMVTEWYVLMGTVQFGGTRQFGPKGDITKMPGCTAVVVTATEAKPTTREMPPFTLNVTKRLGPFNSAGLAMQAAWQCRLENE